MPRARWFSQFLTISVWFSIDAAAAASRRSRLTPFLLFTPRRGLPRALFVFRWPLASLLRRLSRCRPRFLVAVPVETMRVRFHNIEQSFISGFEGRGYARGGEKDREREGEGKQNVRQLLNVAGAAPCWVDFAGVVIEDNWEQPSRETNAPHTYMCVNVRDTTVVYLYVDSCT